jgi:hypothetical protein
MSETPVNSAAKEAAIAAAAGVREGNLYQREHPCNGVSRILDADTATIDLFMADGVTPRKKFALVGFASSTRLMAPYDDPSWAIAGMNQLVRLDDKGYIGHIPRADWWFEIHREWNTALVPGSDHLKFLQEFGLPLVMTSRLPELPTSMTFPIAELIADAGDYFTSTVAYMIAWTTRHIDRLVAARLRDTPPNGLATALDVLELTKSIYAEYAIALFGIDLIAGEEYEQQKACAEFWLGRALARGITVIIPPQSALLKQRYRYGYEMEPQDLVKESDIAKRRAYLQTEHQKHSEIAVQLVGAVRTIEALGDDLRPETIAARLAELKALHQTEAEASMQLHGAITEIDYMMEFRRLKERGGTIG